MTPDNDAMRALEAVDKYITDKFGKHIEISPLAEDIETIRTALQISAQIDNETRIKVLEEMGFEYLPVKDEAGTLISHAIGHPDDKGFFVNHTNLMCAMQRIRIAVGVLAQAKTKAQVDGLVKALSDLIDDLKERAKWMHFEPQEGGTVLPCGNGVYIAAEKALHQFNAKEVK